MKNENTKYYNTMHAIVEAPVSEAGEQYYCPMRCEGDKTYDHPGDCPVCGMHLIQEVSLTIKKTEEKGSKEAAYRDMLKRSWIAPALSVPVLCISMTAYVPRIILEKLFPARVLFTIFGLLLSPIIADAAMSFSSVSVIRMHYGLEFNNLKRLSL